ncbi:MAG: glutamine--fructose-6-phosphate transaminase (isomerizing) [Deltaproteobacteria bacterium]|nr:glutamine--fructose-6-phosphate transaminase (isomerizing) [Deltaproteobacteria bacterium]MBI2365705.1 glutamine--fructose-6-phosphate transaminase (isomerizing) [Deltaproteobacteria bacterium]
MCGIVGYIGKREAAPLILESLRKLEYRGYDSAGIAVLDDGRVTIRRCEGKLNNLETLLNRQPVSGAVGIGHTRWATHGRPSETNAHPHRAGDVVVVHNGIIENYLELKEQLSKRGTQFSSETDTEIVAHLVSEKIERGMDFLEAVRRTLREIRGSYALLFLNRRDPRRLIVAKNSTPIVIGWGEGETFIASDIPALLDYTRKVTFLEDGELGEVTLGSYRLFDARGKIVHRPVKEITWDAVAAQKGGFAHFMLKEIHDQPRALADTFRGRISLKDGQVSLEDIHLKAREVKQIQRIHLVACGTAWHACLVGKFMLEEIAGIPAEVDYGSEFRYRSPLMDPKSILLMVSQSGETADTLAATEIARAKKAKILSICNVIDSSIPRKSHGVLYTHAGPEISVASTKAFTTQLTALYLLAVALGRLNGKLKQAGARKLLRDLMHLPHWIEETLKIESEVKELARELMHYGDFLYLGRGVNYPIALEGALKLKEISYIHAEGYPAGEMKHGPIALIDETMPVVVLAPRDRYFEKTMGNLKEVEARGGKVIVLTDDAKSGGAILAHRVLTLPKACHYLTPIVMTIPLQLLAYYIAVQRGTDVDQPRNLAKSVTVE